jgi:hypothetical protein
MAVNRTVRGYRSSTVRVSGEIDDPNQQREFDQEWANIVKGIPPAKTASARNAFLLYVDMNGVKSQVYLYDAPGEDFESVAGLDQQLHFSLLKGVILLIDPKQLVGSQSGTLDKVVASTLAKALLGMSVGKDGKLPLRVAVVIAKADLPQVREALGGHEPQTVSSQTCRNLIAAWGGDNAMRTIENRVREVAYFACSALGRSVDSTDRVPFQDRGVLEPLVWVLQD